MIFRQGPQNIISCLGAVSPEGKALYVAAQQPLQRRKVASVIIRWRDLRHDLNSVLPCVDNAVLNARCDLRWKSGSRNATRMPILFFLRER